MAQGHQDSLPFSEHLVKASTPQEVLPATESKTDLFANLPKSKQGISWQELCAAFEKRWGEPLPNITLVRYGPHAEDVLIGKSATAKQLPSVIRQVAPTNETVLLQGPGGTGKGVLARAIYSCPSRRNKQFMSSSQVTKEKVKPL